MSSNTMIGIEYNKWKAKNTADGNQAIQKKKNLGQT